MKLKPFYGFQSDDNLDNVKLECLEMKQLLLMFKIIRKIKLKVWFGFLSRLGFPTYRQSACHPPIDFEKIIFHWVKCKTVTLQNDRCLILRFAFRVLDNYRKTWFVLKSFMTVSQIKNVHFSIQVTLHSSYCGSCSSS